jgi:hypothetical protein
METDGERDWGRWSREAVEIMQSRNRAFIEKFALSGQAFRWDLDVGEIAFVSTEYAVVADLCVVGSISAYEETFLWAWANEAIPPRAQERLHVVRSFGETHDLGLLTTAEWPAGRAEGLEMLAVAGRVLDADGVFVAPAGDLTLFFVLHRFRAQPLSEVAWLTNRSTDGSMV